MGLFTKKEPEPARPPTTEELIEQRRREGFQKGYLDRLSKCSSFDDGDLQIKSRGSFGIRRVNVQWRGAIVFEAIFDSYSDRAPRDIERYVPGEWEHRFAEIEDQRERAELRNRWGIIK